MWRKSTPTLGRSLSLRETQPSGLSEFYFEFWKLFVNGHFGSNFSQDGQEGDKTGEEGGSHFQTAMIIITKYIIANIKIDGPHHCDHDSGLVCGADLVWRQLNYCFPRQPQRGRDHDHCDCSTLNRPLLWLLLNIFRNEFFPRLTSATLSSMMRWTATPRM